MPASFAADDDGIADEDAEGPPDSDSAAVCDAGESVPVVSTVRGRPVDGGRDLDLSIRDGDELVDMVEGRLVGTDMRRSALKGAGGTMAKGGTELGSNGRPELDPSPSL
jgi:hypothetical protein